MAAPAAATVLRANPRPNIAYDVASAFECMTALVAEGTHSAALDAELKAYTDGDGEQPFVDGVSTTEAELAALVEAQEHHGQAFIRAVMRYFYDLAL